MKKLIIDSLIYWVEEFDVDGFRFDLGELLGIELLVRSKQLKRIKPGILLLQNRGVLGKVTCGNESDGLCSME